MIQAAERISEVLKATRHSHSDILVIDWLCQRKGR